MTGTRKKMLLIFMQDTDTWEGQPLYEAIVRFLQAKGMAGATVWNGAMGYGVNQEIHRSGLFGIADEKPIILAAIEDEERIRPLLPSLLDMVQEGLVALHDVEVLARRRQEPHIQPSPD